VTRVVLGVEVIRPPLTGTGRYALELATHLSELDGIEDLRFFAGRKMVESPGDALSAPMLSLETRKRLAQSKIVLGAYRVLAPLHKRMVLRAYAGYVFHGPNYYIPPFPGPAVATFHDLSIYKFPEHHPEPRVRYMQKEIPLALKRAAFLITDSEATRREVVEYFGLPVSSVVAVPLASGGAFKPRSEVETRSVLERFGLTHGRYLLYVGTIEPRKNLGVLLDAYAGLPAVLRERYPLVLAGYRGWKSEALLARIGQLRSRGMVHYLDYVEEENLPILFSGARAFAYPSLYEGFGLPVLEALGSGIPVVCSNATSLPEVAGDAALLVEGGDVDATRNALEKALADESWRSLAIKLGLAQASRFTWHETACKTLDVYNMALAKC